MEIQASRTAPIEREYRNPRTSSRIDSTTEPSLLDRSTIETNVRTQDGDVCRRRKRLEFSFCLFSDFLVSLLHFVLSYVVVNASSSSSSQTNSLSFVLLASLSGHENTI